MPKLVHAGLEEGYTITSQHTELTQHKEQLTSMAICKVRVVKELLAHPHLRFASDLDRPRIVGAHEQHLVEVLVSVVLKMMGCCWEDTVTQ